MYTVKKILIGAFQIQWTKEWCIELMEDTIAKYGRLRYTNSDQGSSYTSGPIHRLCSKEMNIQISMDGRDRALDNFYIGTFLEVDQIMKDISESLQRGLDLYQMVKGVISSSIIPKRRHTEIGKKCAPDQFINAKKMAS